MLISFKNKYSYLSLSMYVAGIIGLSIPSLRPYFQLFTPIHLLAVAYFVFYELLKNRDLLYYILIISSLGFMIEIIGVNTGLIFGEYAYGQTLGFKLWGTPPMIGVNWLLMMYCSTIFCISKIKSYKIITSLMVATLMTLFDIIVEPVAIQLDMWSWTKYFPPMQNYIAWFIISFVFSFLTIDLIKEKNNPKAIFIFAVQWIFFIGLFFILK